VSGWAQENDAYNALWPSMKRSRDRMWERGASLTTDGVAAHFRFMSKPDKSDCHLTRKGMHTAIKRYCVSFNIFECIERG